MTPPGKWGARACLALAWSAWLTIPTGGAYAQVLIQPVVVELSQQKRVASVAVSLSSTAKSPLRLQADVFHWAQGLDGRPITGHTDDLLVTPPLTVIRPGERQVFRVAFRHASPSNDELAYRLLIEDITSEADANSLTARDVQVRFRTNYDLPVLVASLGKPTPRLRWKACPDASLNASEVCLRVLNDGNRRVRVQKVTVLGANREASMSLQESETLLAGTEREWRIPILGGATLIPQSVLIESGHGETLKAEDGGF